MAGVVAMGRWEVIEDLSELGLAALGVSLRRVTRGRNNDFQVFSLGVIH